MLGSPHGWRGGAGRRRTAPTPRRGPEDAQGEGAAGGEQSLIRECGWTDRGTGGSGGGPPHEGPRAHPQAGGQPGRPRPGRSHAGPEGGGELRCCPAPRSRRQLPVGGGGVGLQGGSGNPRGSARLRPRMEAAAPDPGSSKPDILPGRDSPPDTRHPPPRPDAPPESRHSPNIPPTPRGSRSRGSRPHGTPAGSDPHPHPGGPRTWAGGDWGASPRFCPSPDCAPRFARGAAAACPPTPICKHPWEGAGLSPHPGGSSGAGQGVPLEQAQGPCCPDPPKKSLIQGALPGNGEQLCWSNWCYWCSGTAAMAPAETSQGWVFHWDLLPQGRGAAKPTGRDGMQGGSTSRTPQPLQQLRWH